jgi:hypothetical protein
MKVANVVFPVKRKICILRFGNSVDILAFGYIELTITFAENLNIALCSGHLNLPHT